MISVYCFVFLIFGLFQHSQSLQSGYTCETSVTLTCPDATKLIILEVTYSSECPNLNEEKNGSAIYAPSRCIGYYRDHTSSLCNGKQTCTIDNNLGQRPSFLVGKQSNCEFTGQSINIDYSCVLDFYSSKLPRIDICSLQSLHDLTEGFIHTPNYPSGYPNNVACSKTVPAPPAGHRLKIYTLDFDIEGLSVLRFLGVTRINDWLQINNNKDKMYGTRAPYTLLFDDIIEASLMFKSDFANTKRPYNGFLLYFIVTPIRVVRPSTTRITDKTTSISPSTTSFTLSTEESTVSIQSKISALVSNEPRQNTVGLTLLVVLLSGILFIILCAFILYKRRNDRRVRYLTDMFNSFFPPRPKNVTLDTSDETTLNNTVQSKVDLSFTSNDEKFVQTPTLKHGNINEKRENQEKQIFIENLKTCPSPYSSYRRSDKKFHTKEQINNELNPNSNIYSQDPLSQKIDNNSLLYEYVDLNQQQEQKPEEVIYDVINPNNERPVEQETDYDSVMYATPKNV